MVLIMAAILDKKNKTLNKFYGDFDDNFGDEEDVAFVF